MDVLATCMANQPILPIQTFQGTCTLIGQNNTPIGKTARLLKIRTDVKNNFHLVVLKWIIAFPLKKLLFIF